MHIFVCAIPAYCIGPATDGRPNRDSKKKNKKKNSCNSEVSQPWVKMLSEDRILNAELTCFRSYIGQVWCKIQTSQLVFQTIIYRPIGTAARQLSVLSNLSGGTGETERNFDVSPNMIETDQGSGLWQSMWVKIWQLHNARVRSLFQTNMKKV